MAGELPAFLVNQTRWSDALKSLAVLKGLDHVELLAQLAGVIVLENDRPEHKYPAGEALAWGQYLLAAQGAGIVGYVGLRNPSGSGKLVIIEQMGGRRPTAGVQYMGLARGETATLRSTEQPRDTRWQPSGAFGTAAPNIAGQIVSARSDTLVVLPFVTSETGGHQNGGQPWVQQFQRPIVLQPGDTCYIWSSDASGGTVANELVQASFVWRERTLEPTEA